MKTKVGRLSILVNADFLSEERHVMGDDFLASHQPGLCAADLLVCHKQHIVLRNATNNEVVAIR
jgi:hypothetical protein